MAAAITLLFYEINVLLYEINLYFLGLSSP